MMKSLIIIILTLTTLTLMGVLLLQFLNKENGNIVYNRGALEAYMRDVNFRKKKSDSSEVREILLRNDRPLALVFGYEISSFNWEKKTLTLGVFVESPSSLKDEYRVAVGTTLFAPVRKLETSSVIEEVNWTSSLIIFNIKLVDREICDISISNGRTSDILINSRELAVIKYIYSNSEMSDGVFDMEIRF